MSGAKPDGAESYLNMISDGQFCGLEYKGAGIHLKLQDFICWPITFNTNQLLLDIVQPTRQVNCETKRL